MSRFQESICASQRHEFQPHFDALETGLSFGWSCEEGAVTIALIGPMGIESLASGNVQTAVLIPVQ